MVLLTSVLVRLAFVRVISASRSLLLRVIAALLPVPLLATDKTSVVTVLA